ncbi:MAG TPA: prepilin-type N-terminal cleavage/methylation domain-containing protein [Verrucomicrobiae bacterium]|nr:prepilin-type N-terminal cleavage/methylation domain-containing protein [Verrucomicrobiae bacterium]
MKINPQRPGFTLIELLVVISETSQSPLIHSALAGLRAISDRKGISLNGGPGAYCKAPIRSLPAVFRFLR